MNAAAKPEKNLPVWWFLHVIFRDGRIFKIGNDEGAMKVLFGDLKMDDKSGATYTMTMVRSDNLHMEPPVGTITTNANGTYKAVWNETAGETGFVKQS